MPAKSYLFIDPLSCDVGGNNNVTVLSSLQSLFPCFMKTPKLKKHNSLKGNAAKFEEHVCTIVASLIRDLPEGSVSGLIFDTSQRKRGFFLRLLLLEASFF